MTLTSAERLDGARDQCQRFLGPAGEGIGGAEGCGDVGYSVNELPRAADMEAPLQDPGRAREVSANRVRRAESEQREEQRLWMIGLLGDPQSGFGMSDGLVEPAEVGKRGGKRVLRGCRYVHRRSETLSEKLALESDVPLQEFGCFAVLAPGEVSLAQKKRCDYLDGAIAEVACDGERLLPKFESCVVVANGPPRVHHPGGDPPEPMLIAERPGEHLRLLEVIQHACPIAEREKRSPNLETDVDGQLASAAGLGQMT